MTGSIKLSDSEAGVETWREHRQAERSLPPSGELYDPVNLIGGGMCGQRDLGQTVCRFDGAEQDEWQDPVRRKRILAVATKSPHDTFDA